MNKSEFLTKLKRFFKWIMPEVAIIIGGLLLDLISKAIFASLMEEGDSVVLIPKLLNFTYTVNTRAAFGSDWGLGKLFGENGVMIFFIVITVLAVGLFGYLLFKKPKKGMLFRIAFSLIIAGALGNLYDRVFLEGVRDFIEFEYLGLTIFGSTTFAIFNIADSCVVIGVIMLLIFYLFFDKEHKEKPKAEEAAVTARDDEAELPEQTDATEVAVTEVAATESAGESLDNADEGESE